MPDVQIDKDTYERLLMTSRLIGQPVGEVIRMLVSRLTAEAPDAETGPAPVRATPPRPAADPANEWIAIHKIYKNHRIEGTFNPSTHEVRLATSPWTNKYFASPTAAAVAVVDHYSSDVRDTNNTNGRKFWKVTATGENLRSIIGERMS